MLPRIFGTANVEHHTRDVSGFDQVLVFLSVHMQQRAKYAISSVTVIDHTHCNVCIYIIMLSVLVHI